MKLFHTSATKIKEITENGIFGSFLCFSSDIYTTGSGYNFYVYTVDIDESEFIEARSLFYHDDWKKLIPIIDEVKKEIEVDEDTAVNLLSEETSLVNLNLHTNEEKDWWLQHQTAECAKALGFKGCIMTDEQGCLYMIDAKQIELKLHSRPKI